MAKSYTVHVYRQNPSSSNSQASGPFTDRKLAEQAVVAALQSGAVRAFITEEEPDDDGD